MTTLSDKVKELIHKARIVSFAKWENSHPTETVEIFQTADNEGRYLTDTDLEKIKESAPDSSAYIPVVQFLRDGVNEIVDEAREQVLTTFPGILEPGGGLYPTQRASACWRDFWHFLRCITYGIAGSHSQYTSDTGLHYMKLLYEELQVPLDAMVVGLEGIKTASLKRCNQDEQSALAPYFDHLIAKMAAFNS